MLATLVAGAAAVGVASPASAHVVPSTTIALAVHSDRITASLTLPGHDLQTASGIRLPSGGGALTAGTAARVAGYLAEHFRVASSGRPWTVRVGGVRGTTTQQYGTPEFAAVTATATLTPPPTADLRRFTLRYDAIVHQVVTEDVFVTLRSDWAAGVLDSTRAIGAIRTDTVTGTVPPLVVDLDDGSPWQGFAGMVGVGVAHIAEGTDHQLFLLTLLLPAPLLARRRRWASAAPVRLAVRRITLITAAFTAGHSITLAIGASGILVPQAPIEALIAVSIVVAAIHAIRPVFPGREAWVAAGFGLVHGLAFSRTLSSLGLDGGELVISLLGFNLGIELMQLAVVLVVLPPLLVLARTSAFPALRVALGTLAGLAAAGWLLARVGLPNAVGDLADRLGPSTPWLAALLWLAAAVVLVRARDAAPAAEPLPAHQVDGAAPRGR